MSTVPHLHEQFFLVKENLSRKNCSCKWGLSDTLEWPEIYSLPHRVTSDTKLREFQFKLLNKYLATKAFLYKIGVASSPLRSFCEKENESLEHSFIHCNYAEEFWAAVIKWLRSLNVNISNLNDKEIMLGMPNCKDELLVNHVLLIAKQYLYFVVAERRFLYLKFLCLD